MSSVKVSWGVKIAALYGGFVLLIAVLVVGSMRQDFDLVSADYYQQELQYQDVIDAGKNQSALSSPVSIHANESDVIVRFPVEFQRESISGTIHFYSAIQADWDKKFDLSVANNEMTIPRAGLENTKYTIKLQWTAGEKNYYQESQINLQ